MVGGGRWVLVGGGWWVVEVVMVLAVAVEVVLVLHGGWCVARFATCAGNGSAPCVGIWMVGGAWRMLRNALGTDQRRALE